MATAVINEQKADKVKKTKGTVTHDFGQPEWTTITKDVAYGLQTNKEGKKERVVLDVDEANQAEKEGKFEGNVVTTKVTLPANFAAVLHLAQQEYSEKDKDGNEVKRDIDEVMNDLVTLFRPGMQAKATNRRNSRLLDTDDNGNFTFGDKDLKDGYLDLTSDITSPSKRIFLTEEQRTWKSLSALPANIRENMWKAYLSSVGKEFYVPVSE